MANGIDGSNPQPNRTSDPTVEQAGAKPRTKRKRTPSRTEPRTETVLNPPIEETKVVLDEVTSEAARENVDIHLKAANVESLPDELVGGSAALLIMLLDGIGMLALGDYAKMNNAEKNMIEEPLKRILAKVSPGSLQMIGKYGDPVMLSMGLLAWVSRVTMESRKRKENPKPVSNEPEPKILTPTPTASVNEVNTAPPADIIANFDVAGVIQ